MRSALAREWLGKKTHVPFCCVTGCDDRFSFGSWFHGATAEVATMRTALEG